LFNVAASRSAQITTETTARKLVACRGDVKPMLRLRPVPRA
jgi:hypothetical protein